MPKLIKNPEDKKKNLLITRIDYECNLRGIEIEQKRAIAQMSQTTFDKRRHDPGKFTINEILRFCDRLKIPIWELLKPDGVK